MILRDKPLISEMVLSQGPVPPPKDATTCRPTRRAPGAIPGTLSRARGFFLRDGCNRSDSEELGFNNDDRRWRQGGGVDGATSF
jgi:hypothetical protein